MLSKYAFFNTGICAFNCDIEHLLSKYAFFNTGICAFNCDIEHLLSKYCKRGYFRWGKISRKCWQDLSRGGNIHDTAPISFIKAYGFFFRVGLFSRKRQKREKRENYPHAKISTFTVCLLQHWYLCLQLQYTCRTVYFRNYNNMTDCILCEKYYCTVTCICCFLVCRSFDQQCLTIPLYNNLSGNTYYENVPPDTTEQNNRGQTSQFCCRTACICKAICPCGNNACKSYFKRRSHYEGLRSLTLLAYAMKSQTHTVQNF